MVSITFLYPCITPRKVLFNPSFEGHRYLQTDQLGTVLLFLQLAKDHNVTLLLAYHTPFRVLTSFLRSFPYFVSFGVGILHYSLPLHHPKEGICLKPLLSLRQEYV
jgi:hypothetical protein